MITRRFFKQFSCAFVLLASAAQVTLADLRRMTPESLIGLGRVGDAAVSPDGKQVAYLVTHYDLQENSSTVTMFLQMLEPTPSDRQAIGFGTPLASSQPTILLKGVKGLGALNWMRRPDGDRLLYIAPGKEQEPKPQAWLMDPAKPEEAVQITTAESGIANLKPSPVGDAVAFTMDVKLDATVNELYADLPKADARIIDSLMYRHWDTWHDYSYSHLHIARISQNGPVENIIDLMKDMRADCPMPPFGGSEQFAFSPDGSEIALSLKLVERPAESTDSGVYIIPATGGTMKLISPDMPGYDMEPRYSPDGKFIAFQSMERPSFEADRNRIMLYDRSSGGMREVTNALDQTAHETLWSEDSQSLYFCSETNGTRQLFRIGVDGSGLTQVSNGYFDFAAVGLVPGSPWIMIKQQNILRPNELALVHRTDGSVLTITNTNGVEYETLELPKVEQRYFTATDGKKIHAWVILPPDFKSDDDKQWPMLTYCQGGPQGQVGQWFSFRWNFHLMAAKGYVVLAVNRRGLPGFGQQWNDQISGDWGGQAMQDILSATDGMTSDPKIDPQRVAAVGASFGGYTVYWLMGNSGKRFSAMISHCGVYNLESMYGSTEELFFVNWDMGGPYWGSPDVQAKYHQFSPHRFAGNWQVPLLVIHGEKDFRVPITQGIEAFTAAQVQRVPSRFLYFPEEGHWVNKPQNSVLWSRVFFDWLDQYCKPPSSDVSP